MAAVPYTGHPSVEPSGNPPANDYQNITVSPRAFGAQIGEGLEQAGKASLQTGEFFGQAAADDQSNKWQREADNLLYGTGEAGPDGKIDRGYIGLTGEDALRARPQLEQKLDALREKYRSGLPFARSELQFDGFTRHYQSVLLRAAGSHAEQQAKVYGVSVNDATLANGDRTIANNYNNDEHFLHMMEDQRHAAVKKAELQGTSREGAVAEADSRSVQARLNGALAQHDLPAAAQIFKQYGNLLDDKVRPAYQTHIRAGAVNADADAALARAEGRAPSATTTGPRAPLSGNLADRIIGAESGDRDIKNPLSSASGPGQFIDATWLSMLKSTAPEVAEGKTDAQILALKGDRPLARQMTAAYAAQNADFLSARGLPTDDGALYLAHFLGPAGAAKVLSADPATPMRDLVSAEVLRANPNIAGMTAAGVRQLTASRVGAQPNTAPDQMQGQPTAPVAGARPAGNAPTVPPGIPAPGVADLAVAQQENATRLAQTLANLADDPGLASNPEASAAAERKAKAKYNVREVALTGQMKAITEARNAAATDYMRRMMPGKPIDAGILDEMAADPKLDAPTLENLSRAYIAQTRATAEGDTAKFGPKFFDARNRIYLPDSDVNKIRDPSQIIAMANPKPDGSQELTLAGSEKLITELRGRTPDHTAFEEHRKEFIKGVTPLIDKSNPLMGKVDESGPSNLYRLQWDLDQKIEAYRKAGKDPTDLFNPHKPDYMGSPAALAPYQKTLQQSLQDKTRSLTGAAAVAAPANPGAVPLREPGETPQDYMKRIGAGLPTAPAR